MREDHGLMDAENHPYYSGKHKRHGMNVQVLTDAKGRLLWASAALPGAIHDLTARRHGIITAVAKFGVACYADKAYQGAGPMIAVPFRRRPRRLSTDKRKVNANRARNRATRCMSLPVGLFLHDQAAWHRAEQVADWSGLLARRRSRRSSRRSRRSAGCWDMRRQTEFSCFRGMVKQRPREKLEAIRRCFVQSQSQRQLGGSPC